MHQTVARRAAGLSLIGLLSACGGGGSDAESSASIELSAATLAFTAQILDTVPQTQTITATLGEDIVHLAVVHTGTAISSVAHSRAGNTAQITVTPAVPNETGAGRFDGAIAITGYLCADAACSTLAPAETRTVAVNYQISPVVQLVAPYVAVAGTSATATIRGGGFGGFALRGVTFGGTPATSFQLVNDGEITAVYPALAAGNHTVQLDVADHQGAITSTATLVTVAPVDHVPAVLPYPSAPTAIQSVVYDAERSAVLVATDIAGGTILRYVFANGAWSAPTSQPVAQLQDIALSTNGEQVLALSRTGLTPLTAATLAPGTAVPAPSLATGNFLKNLAVANNNRAIITTGIAQSAATALYVYVVSIGSMLQSNVSLNNSTPGASYDAALIVFVQGDPSLTADPPVHGYTASSDTFGQAGISVNQNGFAPVVDRNSGRTILNGTRVYDSALALFGTLQSTPQGVAIRLDGQRAYTYDAAAGGVLTFDITANPDSDVYPPLAAAVPL
ncbi:MAG: IPT/TIG domain-containing protein, partial [Steroidobacteraceae bacterium]